MKKNEDTFVTVKGTFAIYESGKPGDATSENP